MEAEQVEAGCEGLIYLPYLMGERTPHLDPLARGAFFGITGRHQRAHFIRAILEGVTFSLHDCLRLIRALDLPVEEIRVSGGGARRELWKSIQADVFQQPVFAVEANEGPAFGAAVLAGVGAGCFTDVQTACDTLIRTDEGITPAPRNVSVYEKAYGLYGALYESLKPHFREVSTW